MLNSLSFGGRCLDGCPFDNRPAVLGLSKCEYAVKSQRPVNLDLTTIKLPVTAYASILHRISGAILFFGIIILLWGLDKSLTSAEGFAEVKECLSGGFAKLVIWGLMSALLYHLVAGVRHILMDLGLAGDTLEAGKLGAKAVLIIAAVLIVLAGVWIW